MLASFTKMFGLGNILAKATRQNLKLVTVPITRTTTLEMMSICLGLEIRGLM